MNTIEALAGWSLLPGPLYLRLARSIEAGIARGDLSAGTMLPPERSLARSLAVGRSTVVAAYDQLRTEGVLISRRGSGTWVQGAPRTDAGQTGRTDSLSSAAPQTSDLIDLATARMPTASAVRAGLAQLASPESIDLLDATGYTPAGLPELRVAVADMHTSQGLATSPEQILITTGTQQALSLLTAEICSAGGKALVEDPTSPGILDLLRAGPVMLRSTASLAQGGAGPLIDAVHRERLDLVYVMTSGGPEGRAASAAQLQELGRVLGGYEGTIIDDASALSFGDHPASSVHLAAYASQCNVATVGSMSKMYWGGLRVGWVRAEEATIHRLARLKRRHDLGTPQLSQLLSVWLLRRLQEVRAERRIELQSQVTLAQELARTHLPDFTYNTPDTSPTLWMQMPRGVSGPFVEMARRQGVAVVAGESLSVGGASDRFVRVAVGAPSADLAAGIERLGLAWALYDRSGLHVKGTPDELLPL